MISEIGPGIFQIKMRLPWPVDFMPFSPSTVNAYVVVQGEKLMLVDSGLNSAECRLTMGEDLGRLGLAMSDITDLVITHFHSDHIGLMDVLSQASPEASIHVHPADLAMIRDRYFRPAGALAELMSWLTLHGLPEREDADVGAIRLDSGEFAAGMSCAAWGEHRTKVLDLDGQDWQLIWTPGHTPGHLAVYGPAAQILLGGDQLLASTTSNVSKHPGSGDNPLRDYRSSLATLADLSSGPLWSGHGEPVEDVPARVSRVLRQQERKLDRLLDCFDTPVATPIATAYDIAGRMWDRGQPDLDANSRRLALTETMAMLAYLESTGDLTSRADATGLVTYALSGR